MGNDRLQREAHFHDHAFSADTRARAGKFYWVAARAKQHYQSLIEADCGGKTVLEYGCGKGSHAFALARSGAEVSGIDMSTEGIRQATARANAEALGDRLSFDVMNAEDLAFPDNHFDLVCGSGILHHLDLEKACAELVRVLKPSGRAVFFEPLGHNPLINLYRSMTPDMRSADEHPLLEDDLDSLATSFLEVKVSYFVLFALTAVPFRNLPGITYLLSLLERVDGALLRLPFAQKHAWLAVIQLEFPKLP
ncbi:MAG: class I SAM-dependent methyltransferase [Candidatus Tectomicrobia bacterium]|nr:class I SAM-dependent methyltransferase [Candidatus Tectomicrobia bacterium]